MFKIEDKKSRYLKKGNRFRLILIDKKWTNFDYNSMIASVIEICKHIGIKIKKGPIKSSNKDYGERIETIDYIIKDESIYGSILEIIIPNTKLKDAFILTIYSDFLSFDMEEPVKALFEKFLSLMQNRNNDIIFMADMYWRGEYLRGDATSFDHYINAITMYHMYLIPLQEVFDIDDLINKMLKVLLGMDLEVVEGPFQQEIPGTDVSAITILLKNENMIFFYEDEELPGVITAKILSTESSSLDETKVEELVKVYLDDVRSTYGQIGIRGEMIKGDTVVKSGQNFS